MNKEQAVTYLKFSGFSEEQIKAIEGAFTCDKCVYSTSEGCQYDDITEAIPPFETSDDAISREAVINHICESKDCYKDECKGRLYKRCHDLEWVYELPSVNPQKPICPSAGVDCEDCPAYEKKSECEHDHEILKAYSDGASAVLDKVRAEIIELRSRQNVGVMECLDIIDKYIEEDKA